MGSLCSSDPEPVPTAQTVVSGTQLPEWMSQGGEQLFTQAKELAKQDYTPYAGPRVASFNADDQSAFNLMRGSTGNWQPQIGKAGSLVDQGAQGWDAAAMERYMNPYAKGVTDIAANELLRNNSIAQVGRNDAAAKAGAFGGSRHGVVDAEANRNLQQSLSDLYLRGGAAAYESALGAFSQDQARKLQAAEGQAGVARAGQELTQKDAEALSAIGGQQRAMDQANLDTAKADFDEQKMWPFQQLNFALGALRGTPYSQQTSQTTTGQQYFQQPSVFGQIAGAGMTGLAAYNLGKTAFG